MAMGAQALKEMGYDVGDAVQSVYIAPPFVEENLRSMEPKAILDGVLTWSVRLSELLGSDDAVSRGSSRSSGSHGSGTSVATVVAGGTLICYKSPGGKKYHMNRGCRTIAGSEVKECHITAEMFNENRCLYCGALQPTGSVAAAAAAAK